MNKQSYLERLEAWVESLEADRAKRRREWLATHPSPTLAELQQLRAQWLTRLHTAKTREERDWCKMAAKWYGYEIYWTKEHLWRSMLAQDD